MMIFFCFRTLVPAILMLLALSSVTAQDANRETGMNRIVLVDELRTLYDISTLPAYRSNTISAQVSTYDPTGGNEDGFNGNFSFVRRNADSTLVLFDVVGSGVINRIWTPTPTNDTLDFYIDDTTRPALSIN